MAALCWKEIVQGALLGIRPHVGVCIFRRQNFQHLVSSSCSKQKINLSQRHSSQQVRTHPCTFKQETGIIIVITSEVHSYSSESLDLSDMSQIMSTRSRELQTCTNDSFSTYDAHAASLKSLPCKIMCHDSPILDS